MRSRSSRRLFAGLAAAVCTLLFVRAAVAQTAVDNARAHANKISAAILARRAVPGVNESLKESVKFALRPRANLPLYLYMLSTADAVHALRNAADEARVDKQIGAASQSSGSTSLTSKGSAPAVLGFAVENGALEKSVSGTAVTFTGRPVQVIQALQKTPFGESFRQIEDNATLGALNRLSFAATLDTARDNAEGTFTASANQLSSYSVHFDVVNYRDPRSSRFDAKWGELRINAGQAMAQATYDAYVKVLEDPEFAKRLDAWLDASADAIAMAMNANKAESAVQDVIDARLGVFPSAEGISGADAALRGFADASAAMLDARSKLLDFVGTAPIVSIDFVGDRAAVARPGEIQVPDTSTVNVILETAPFHGGSFTLNGSATIFNTVPVNITASRLRHVEVSSQLDIPVAASAPQIGNVVLSFAFKYKHLPNDVLGIAAGGRTATTGSSNADAAFKGDILYGQAKLTFPVKGSGIKIPISVTFANRSELIKESVVRANLGFTFDMDTIIGKLKP